MCKKMIYLVSLALVLASTGLISAATLTWDKGGVDALWSTPANWNPDGVPTAADTANFYLPDANCLIDDSVAAECTTFQSGSAGKEWCNLDMTGGTLALSGNFDIGRASGGKGRFIMSGGVATTTAGRLWVGYNGTGEFIMRGGVTNIYDKVELGKNASGFGAVYMEGGVLNLTGNSTDLEIGTYGHGRLMMTGGVINLQDQIKLSQGNATTRTGIGELWLYGGTLNANNLRNPADGIYGHPSLDITEGVLNLNGDRRAIVNDYINRGWLVAYDGNGVVDAVYTVDPNRTQVTGRRLPPGLAWGPTPKNRSTVSRPVTLKWEPGLYVVTHDVYLGTDFNDVNTATRDDPRSVLVSMGQAETAFDPGVLALGQTYYWRVDEVNDANAASPWKGVVFQFTVADYIVVDDFESYNDLDTADPASHLIYKTWLDGWDNPAANGAVVGHETGVSWMEKKTVHGGLQSVPVTYNKTAALVSEVSVKPADLPIGTNWATDNVSTLSLWFYGSQFNGAADMYVKLNGVKVLYSSSSDLQAASWHEWTIPLASFNIDLSDVTDLTIGFSRTDPSASFGTIFVDDIRLLTATNP